MASDIHKLSELQTELLAHILAHLPGTDIAICKRVSRTFRDTVEVYPLLRYRIACCLAGLVEGPAARHMSLYDRTVELDRWRTLRRKGLRMSDTTIEQMDGLLRRVAPGGSAYCELIARTITVIQPASERSRQPNRRRTLPTLGFTPQHFACDHSQKVLILLQITDISGTWRVRVLSSETGEPHPLAKQGSFTFEGGQSAAGECGVSLKLYGPMLAVTSSTPRGTGDILVGCWILDWKTGSVLLNASSRLLAFPSASQSFAILDTRHIIFPIFSSLRDSDINAIAVYDVYRKPRIGGSLQDASKDATLVLELPTPLDRARYESIVVDSTPPPPIDTHQDDAAVFLEDPRTAIIAVTMSIRPKGNIWLPNKTVAIIVRAETVHHFLEQSTTQSSPVVVPWASWKSRTGVIEDVKGLFTSSSRLFLHSLNFPEMAATALSGTMILWDFDRSCTVAESSAAQRPSGLATVVKHLWLEEALVSYLPYRFTMVDLSLPVVQRYAARDHQIHGDGYVVIHTEGADNFAIGDSMLAISRRTYFV